MLSRQEKSIIKQTHRKVTMTEMMPATETGRLMMVSQRNAARDFRKLLNRWTVAAGRENAFLAELTVLVLNGEDYGDAIAKIS